MPSDKEFDPDTFAIIGAAMEVHRYWGPGYLESVYRKSLALELRRQGRRVQQEVPFPLAYKGDDLGVVYRADLIVDGVLVELKAHAGICDADIAQTLHYMRSSSSSRGLLLNFGLPSLQQRRFVMGREWMDR